MKFIPWLYGTAMELTDTFMELLLVVCLFNLVSVCLVLLMLLMYELIYILPELFYFTECFSTLERISFIEVD